jgi:hypothetical protein
VNYEVVHGLLKLFQFCEDFFGASRVMMKKSAGLVFVYDAGKGRLGIIQPSKKRKGWGEASSVAIMI